MKTKFIFALAVLLLMGSACLKAQESNNSSTTYEEGDLNHDGEVDVADITCLVNLIMNQKKTDYSKKPFTIVPIDSEIRVLFSPYVRGTSHDAYSISYSTDGGQTWSSIIGDYYEQLTIASDEELMIKLQGGIDLFGSFSVSGGNFNVEGNIMSLIKEGDFESAMSIQSWDTFYLKGFFKGKTNLISAENLVLPATYLAENCYANMFEGCTSLTKAPKLPATTLVNGCYASMFAGCTSLKYVNCSATDISAQDCTKDWLKDVSPTGTFVKASSMEGWTIGASGIPSGWTVK